MKCTVKQLAEKNPCFTESAIRWMLFNRKTNGLSVAVTKLGKKILVDDQKFNEWVESHREA
jgi:hypothetical protein